MDTFVLETKTVEVPYYDIDSKTHTTASITAGIIAGIGMILLMIKIVTQNSSPQLNFSDTFVFLVIYISVIVILFFLILKFFYRFLRKKKWEKIETKFNITDKNKSILKYPTSNAGIVKSSILIQYYDRTNERFNDKLMIVCYQGYYYVYKLFS